jgi:hypothetical protein
MTGILRTFLVGKDALEMGQILAEDRGPTTDDRHGEYVERIAAPATAVSGSRAMVTPELYRDLEVYSAYDGGVERTLMSVLDRTRLRGGRAFLTAAIDNPTDDVAVLRARQATLRRMEARSAGVDGVLQRMAALEPDVLWMFRHAEDAALKTLYDLPFVNVRCLRGLNASPSALSVLNLHRIFVSPAIGLLSPVIYFVIPFLVMRYKLGLRKPFSWWVSCFFASMWDTSAPMEMKCAKILSYAFSLVFYFQSLFTSFEVSTTLQKVCRSITSRVARSNAFFDLATHLQHDCWDEDITAHWFPDLHLTDRDVLDSGTTATLGTSLKAFRSFDHDAAAHVLRRVYALDALTSISATRAAIGGSWVEFASGGDGPRLELVGLRHPGLTSGVTNDWNLGAGTGAARHAVVTGPNAGGKSTLLKGTLLSALLGQTLTIAPCATSCTLTPFHVISSHMNVPDAQGRESLFEAEMMRSKRNLEALSRLTHGQKALVVMDEIFNSTNPVEGIAGAFAVAKRMAAHPGAMCVLSTHYLYLCKLEKVTGKAFCNFRMPVLLDTVASGAPTPTYSLERGISRQYVALELLRASGFGDDVLDDAIAVKEELCAPLTAAKRVRVRGKGRHTRGASGESAGDNAGHRPSDPGDGQESQQTETDRVLASTGDVCVDPVLSQSQPIGC